MEKEKVSESATNTTNGIPLQRRTLLRCVDCISEFACWSPATWPSSSHASLATGNIISPFPEQKNAANIRAYGVCTWSRLKIQIWTGHWLYPLQRSLIHCRFKEDRKIPYCPWILKCWHPIWECLHCILGSHCWLQLQVDTDVWQAAALAQATVFQPPIRRPALHFRLLTSALVAPWLLRVLKDWTRECICISASHRNICNLESEKDTAH